MELQVRTNTIPANFCFNGFNSASWNDLVALQYVVLPDGLAQVNFGSATPTPENRDKPWWRLNVGGTPDRLYVFHNGAWIAPHWAAPGLVCMYEGTEPSIDTFDGGETASVTDRTGPFWEKVTAMNAAFPVGPGTTAGGTVIPIGGVGGEDEHVLTIDEMPSHTHNVNNIVIGTALADGNSHGGTDMNKPGQTRVSASTGGDDPHNNLPPYVGIWFVRRTARLYYRVAP